MRGKLNFVGDLQKMKVTFKPFQTQAITFRTRQHFLKSWKKFSLKNVSMQGKSFNERLLVRNELMLSLSLQKLFVA